MLFGALAMFFVGLIGLQMQVDRTEAAVNFSAEPPRVGEAFNATEGILQTISVTAGTGLPAFFLVAAVVFATGLLLGVSGR